MRKLTIPFAAVVAVTALTLGAGPAAADGDCDTTSRPVSGEVHKLEGPAGNIDPALVEVVHTVDQPLCEAGV